MNQNKLFNRLVLGIAGMLLACQLSTAPTAVSPIANASYREVTDGLFQVEIPDWPITSEGMDAPEAVVGVAEGGFGVWVHRHGILPRVVQQALIEEIVSQEGADLIAINQYNEHPVLEYTLPFEEGLLRFETLLVYCQAGTFSVAFAGMEPLFEQGLQIMERVQASAECVDPLVLPGLERGRLGMTINPANDEYSVGLYRAIRLAKEAGVEFTHLPINWQEVEIRPGEYEWDWQDYVVDLYHHEGYEISVLINLIHTAVRGPVPVDLVDLKFDDPVFIQRFTDFALALLERYDGEIQYLNIGNEVNDYFISSRDEIPAYRTFFLSVKNAISVQHPEVKVAITFAYHDAETQGGLDIIETLNIGDYLPYTLYIYDQGFAFNRDPGELEGFLDRMLELAGETPVGIVELGWNTADILEGTEAGQASLVREAFRLLPDHQDQILFMNWFLLHDGSPENCQAAALSFIPDQPQLAEDQAFMERFVPFLCYLGLREHDGAPKLGWSTFVEEASWYLTVRGSD